MREIKFRALDKQDKRMMQVSVLELPCRSIIFGHIESEQGDKSYLDDVELMLYTGLKDKNGKEIYEGDIVRRFLLAENHPTHLGIVEWLWCSYQVKYQQSSHPLWQGEDTAGYFHMDLFKWAKDVSFGTEVIGNIYENPELLEIK